MVRPCDQIKRPLQKDRTRHSTMQGNEKKGRQNKRWEDNIREWTGLDFSSSPRADEDRQSWQMIVPDVNSCASTTLMVPARVIFFPTNAPGMGRFQLLSLVVLGYGLESTFGSDCNTRFPNTNHNLNHNSNDYLTLNPKSNTELTLTLTLY